MTSWNSCVTHLKQLTMYGNFHNYYFIVQFLSAPIKTQAHFCTLLREEIEAFCAEDVVLKSKVSTTNLPYYKLMEPGTGIMVTSKYPSLIFCAVKYIAEDDEKMKTYGTKKVMHSAALTDMVAKKLPSSNSNTGMTTEYSETALNYMGLTSEGVKAQVLEFSTPTVTNETRQELFMNVMEDMFQKRGLNETLKAKKSFK